MYHQEQLRKFADKKFGYCEKDRFKQQLHDFVSQTEQQLCTDAKVFLYSESSTWSGTIEKDRKVRGLDNFDGSNIVFL